MRSRIAKICIFLFIFLIVATASGCGHYRPKNRKADDEISKAVYEAVGKEVYYTDRTISSDKTLIGYSFLIRDYEDESLLLDIADTVNEKIKELKIKKKIYLRFAEEITGGNEAVAYLCNYYEDEHRVERYETLQSLEIRGTDMSNKGDDSPYNKASTYINLKDIKSLMVTKKIVQSAEEEEIDWYEIWPDLEHYEETDQHH